MFICINSLSHWSYRWCDSVIKCFFSYRSLFFMNSHSFAKIIFIDGNVNLNG